ncbi:hypothetical protein RIVM261_076960 [Rivularia sp. IAM M-261]|nr:hypothetical protein RIVM261_076960 [Rivularia sp. IAM M-261]
MENSALNNLTNNSHLFEPNNVVSIGAEPSPFQSPFLLSNRQVLSSSLSIDEGIIHTFDSSVSYLPSHSIEGINVASLRTTSLSSKDSLLGDTFIVNEEAAKFSGYDGINQSLSQAIIEIKNSLKDFIQQPNYIDKLQIAFGTNWQPETATILIIDFVTGANVLDIEIIDGTQLQSAGAFSQKTNTIYLAKSYLEANKYNIAEIVPVITEELGHYIDAQLNQSDSNGDEGKLFSLLVAGNDLTPQQIQDLKLENDFTNITLNGQTLLVEQSTNDILGTAGRDNLVGTSRNDRITGGFAADIITGGLGSDTFVYNDIRDAGDTIKDFELRTDVIDLTRVLNSFGYNRLNPIGDGYVQFSAYSKGTVVLLDSDGNGNLTARPYINVENVAPSELSGFPGHFLPRQTIPAPSISAGLANDTGVSNSDRITIDPTVSGQTKGATSLQGNLNGNGFINISNALNPDGSFTISLEQYEVLSKGQLPSGNYTLELKAGNSSQVFNTTTVNFTLDRNAPPISFKLAPESDTGEVGDNITNKYAVTLVGKTEPGLEVILVETQQKVTADNNGNFSFTNVTMPIAGEAPFTMVTVDKAGNQGRVQQFLTREGINGAPEITSAPKLIFDTQAQKTYTYQVEATDSDGDTLTYTLLSSPQGTEIDENGLISFTPSGILKPFYDLTVEVSDGRGGTDSQAFTIEITPTPKNNNPQIVSQPITEFGLLASGSNSSKTINAIVRDFKDSHPNFEGSGPWGIYSDMVANRLGEDGKPILNNGYGFITPKDFSQWYNDVPGVNLATPVTLILSETSPGSGIYQFSSNRYFPIDNQLFGNENRRHNYHFTTEIRTSFTYKGGEVFNFNGDDDVWVFIDNRLVVALGGVHAISFGSVRVDTLGLTIGKSYSIDIFHAERQTSGSNFNLQTSLDIESSRRYVYQVKATDLDNESITYKLINAPDGMEIDTKSGLIIWTPTLKQIGIHEVNVTATDSRGGSSSQTFQVNVRTSNPGSIRGKVFEDLNNNGIQDGANLPSPLEKGQQGWTVYIDENQNDIRDRNELFSTTDINGNYIFTNIPLGFYNLNVVSQDGWRSIPSKAVLLNSGQNLTDFNFGIGKGNTNPIITTAPIITGSTNINYIYNVNAFDFDGDNLIYSLRTSPIGMNIDENGIIRWVPGTAGAFLVEVQVDDGKGGIATQRFDLVVALPVTDTEAPEVNFSLNSSVLKLGETLNLKIQGFDNVGLADLDLSFNGNSLALTPDNITNGFINTASLTVNQTGVFEVVAKATDFAGNTDVERIEVRVINPNDKKAPIVELDASGFDPSNLVINERTNIIGTINDSDLEFYRVELAPISLIDISNPAAIDSDYITVAEGRGNVNNGILAQIDPNLYRNDTYYVRVYSQDFSGNINVQGLVLGINSQSKPGEFSLDFTDLSIPLTGIPIEITRSYSSLDANFQGDFGYGWELGMQDAAIVEASPTGVDLTVDNFFGGNSFSVGTRVTLNTPDGRRVGFTFDPVVDGMGFLGARWKPYFRPDPGVYETLEVPYFPLSVRSDSSTGLYLFGFSYNPSDYTLTTKDGTKYNYNQYQGLKTVEDRNGNTLTFADDGITSSTGVEIDFVRDASGRITEIIDPDGKSLKYSYDASGNLIEFTDRTNNETTFKYEGRRPHYLTQIIDPLGRTGVRTEYDASGQISKIFDANGNALDINYNSATSRQTVKDPFGNATTYVFDKRGNVSSEIDALSGVTARTYDRNNNIISETNPEGNTTSYTYDARGNKLTETNGEGNTTRFTYNANNDLLTETDPLGNTTTYIYDARGNLTSRKDAAGKITTYKYNQFGLLTEVVDANGSRSTFTYDFSGNITSLTDPTGAKTNFTYDRNGRITSVTDALGAITNYIYDAQGRLIEKADPEGSSCGCGSGVTRTEYNAAGEKIAEIDALGRRTEYRYNERGLLVETIHPDATPTNLSDNPRTKNEYDALDRLLVTTDELGRKTRYVYDALGRRIEIIYADATPADLSDNPRMKTEYDRAGRVIAEIDELGNRTQLAYDQVGRLISRTNALSETTTYSYDADGRQISMKDALGRITNYGYDALDRLVNTTYANNTVMTTTYDALGRIIAETDLAGNITNYEYDALGRLTGVIDALNQRTEYKYDAVGNLIEQKDANGNITRFEYDTLRRRKAMILPGGQRNETIHNKIGNLIRVTDFNGATTTYEYDARNRILGKAFSDGTPTETFTYTLTGELATVTDNRGVTSYAYDERDRLLSRTEADGRQITYTYDAAGNILSLTVPSGITNYTYDPLNRIDKVIAPDGGITDYTYDAVSNLIKTQFANGVTENQQYDLLNRLTYLENRNQTGIISSYSYTLDAMGNRTKVVENDGRVVDYSYDKLYRLIQEKISDAVAGNKTVQYQFDPVGNRLERIDSVEGTSTYSYDKNDRLIEEVLGGKVTQYQYDNNGNLTAKIENGATQAQYKWNTKGELIAVETTENGETGRVEFEYDHEGIRVAIKVDGEETRFLIDNNQQQYAQVIEEYKPNGTVQASYVHGWDLIFQANVDGRVYYQVDGLGTTRQLTNNNGLIIQEYDYDAYGNLTRKIGNVSNNYLFAGEQFDSAVDGYYLRARYYDPATGRFVSRDPFEGYINQPATLQDYLYGNVNPVNFVDPSGNVAVEYRVITGVGVGAFVASTAGASIICKLKVRDLTSGNNIFISLPVTFAISSGLGFAVGVGIYYATAPLAFAAAVAAGLAGASGGGVIAFVDCISEQ